MVSIPTRCDSSPPRLAPSLGSGLSPGVPRPLLTVPVALRVHRPFAGAALPPLPCYYGLLCPSAGLSPAMLVARRGVLAAWTTPGWSRGPARRYLCASFPACLDPYPGSAWSACTRYFPHAIGLPPVRTGSALSNVLYSDFSTARYFGAAVIHSCSGPQVCSPPRSLLPLRALVGQPWFLRPRLSWFVTSPRSGYANRPHRAIDGIRTFTLSDAQPCRLLP